MLIFLYGDDTYRSWQKLKKIKEKYIKEVDSSNMNLSELDGTSLKFEEFNQNVKASPFLARKRMVIIKNLISENKSKDIQKEIVKLLDNDLNSDDQDNIIVFWEGTDQSKSKSKNELWKRLTKEKYAEEFTFLNPGQVNQWISREISKRKATIDQQAISHLAATVGNDLWHLSNEIEKLIHFKKNEPITIDDIDNLVKAKFDDDIFKFIDAIANNNKKQALKLMSDQINSGSNDLYLLSMLIRQFRILLLIKDLQETYPTVSKLEIAKKLKIHPFVAQKALSQVNNFSLARLKKIFSLLLNIDLKIKTSANKPKTLFDIFIAQI